MGRAHIRRRALIFVAVLAAVVGSLAGYKLFRRYFPPTEMTLRRPVDLGNSADAALVLTPLYPTETTPAHVFRGNFWASPQLVRLPGQEPFLLALPSSGSVAALELRSGHLKWELELPHEKTQTAELRAAPLQVDGQLFVAYTTRDQKNGAIAHRAAVIDLKTGTRHRSFPDLFFKGEAPAAGGQGMVVFDPEWHLPRAISHLPNDRGLGRAYVSFGGDRDQGPWHGWVFELDLDAWRRGSSNRAISSVFVSTNETDCGDDLGKVCGGGIWAYAGPQIHRSPAGDEIVVQTGNGRLDLERGSYAQSLLRLSPGLKFDPQCDAKLCANGNPRAPSNICLASCRNLFVPRLLPTDAPLRPADGSCDGKTFMECLEIQDWDFGSSAPVRLETGGRAFYVTAGKAGDVYLLDAGKLGILYDRRQMLDLCGGPNKPCSAPDEGLVMTQPAAATVDGVAMAVMATYNPDDIHAAGVVAYRVVIGAGGPKLEEAWRVPKPDSPEAKRWFRAPPTRPVVQQIGGEAVVWVADNGRDGRILAIRVKDGHVLANVRSAGWPMRNAKPIVHDNVLYLPAAVQDREDLTWIQAYAISRARR